MLLKAQLLHSTLLQALKVTAINLDIKFVTPWEASKPIPRQISQKLTSLTPGTSAPMGPAKVGLELGSTGTGVLAQAGQGFGYTHHGRVVLSLAAAEHKQELRAVVLIQTPLWRFDQRRVIKFP